MNSILKEQSKIKCSQIKIYQKQFNENVCGGAKKHFIARKL